MGVTESKCVTFAGEAEYLSESYTVVRTGGDQQTGWILSEKAHECYNTDPRQWRPRAHAYLKQEGWAVHLHNGNHTDENGAIIVSHCCGWRRLGTFWPTRLTGDAEAIKAWSDALRDRLEELAGYQGLPDLWREHSCSRGAGPDYCDGCCAERRAKEKKALLDQLEALKPEYATLDAELDTILAEKDHIHDNEDLWDPAVGERWDDLEEEECEIQRRRDALDERAYPLKEALKKIPTAAQHRLWLAYRAKADELEEAEKNKESEERIAKLQEEVDVAHALAFPEEAPPPIEREDDGPPERSVEQVREELKKAKANYHSALMSSPGRPGYDRCCSNFEDEVHDLEKELHHLEASAT